MLIGCLRSQILAMGEIVDDEDADSMVSVVVGTLGCIALGKIPSSKFTL